MTKLKIIILLLILFGTTVRLKTYAQTTCKKCDKTIIETITKKYDKATIKEVEQFLCSLDKGCDLTATYAEIGGSYSGITFEMAVIEFDLYLDECIKMIESNKDIDFNYLLSLLVKSVGHDLPYLSIINKLEKKKTRNPTEQKILTAMKKAETEWNKTHKTQ